MGVATSGTLHHTCFVVHDVEKTAAALTESLGIGPWDIQTIEPAHIFVGSKAPWYEITDGLPQFDEYAT